MRKPVLFVLLALLACSAINAQPIVFTTGEWEPFTGEKLPNQGIATEIIMEVCKAGGIEYKFEFVPWVRAENMIAHGSAFGAFPYAKNEERSSKYFFSDILFYTSTSLMYYEPKRNYSNLEFSNWQALRPYSLIYLAGSWLENDMKSNGIKHALVPDMDAAVRMLYAGRGDLICDEIAVMYSVVKRLYPNEVAAFKIIQTEMFGGKSPIHLMVSRTYPNAQQLLAKFNAGIATVRSNGVLQAIARKYGISIE